MSMIIASLSIGRTTSFAPDVAIAKLSAKKLFRIIDRKPKIVIDSKNSKKPVRSVKHIRITFLCYNKSLYLALIYSCCAIVLKHNKYDIIQINGHILKIIPDLFIYIVGLTYNKIGYY